MQHWIGIVGSGFGILGTGALSFDLLRSKSGEDSLSQFKHLQDELDNASQELAVRMNEGLGTMAEFLAGYLSLLEIEAELAEPGGSTSGVMDPGLEELKKFLSGKSTIGIRQYAVSKFAEAQKKLASRMDTERALGLVVEARGRIQRRFAEEVAHSQRLRRVATIGVWLVGIAAVAQLLDLMLSSLTFPPI